jgi:hypothetical protein
MLTRTFIVPSGHGSCWLDPESLELASPQHEDADDRAAPSALPGRRASEPLRHRPFARLSAGRNLGQAS